MGGRREGAEDGRQVVVVKGGSAADAEGFEDFGGGRGAEAGEGGGGRAGGGGG